MHSARAEELLREGVEAARLGKKARARGLLYDSIGHDPEREVVWLWLGVLSLSAEEATRCVRCALAINPDNQKAQSWLSRLRAKVGEPPGFNGRNRGMDPSEKLAHGPRVVEPSVFQAGLSSPGTSRWPRGRILVVDDSATVRGALSEVLEKHGFEVMLAATGIEALGMLTSPLPDLVLLDITMPHLDGYRICRLIKDSPATRSIPIVILSGRDGAADKMRGRLAGAADYLLKPVVPSRLIAAIDQFVPQAISAPEEDFGRQLGPPAVRIGAETSLLVKPNPHEMNG